MFHLKNRKSPNLKIRTLCVSVFQHTVFLLLLTHCCKGELQVIGPHRPILAVIGDDVILSCHLKPAMDAVSTTVEWTRPDLKPRFVHVWRSGQELLDDQNPQYRGRTSLFIDKLKHGNTSLKLSRVKQSDSGTYRCFLPIFNKDSTVELVFGSVSPLEIEISKLDNGLSLDCKSKGWYPEPEVSWLDGEGHVLSAGPTETVRGPDDLYTVSSRVTVDKRHSNSFTCRVQQNHINQTRETQIQISVDFFMVQSSFAARISICLVVCIIPIVVVVFVVCKWGKN
ncbi:butyrophilin subfamily 3 member A3-like, partial [Plectropomus leopardus]|uniref:butyrophilin subfamily 3 member A3-like n=1 Tax=Plectropomus leopardus TaxID=160734 RepID=UPI001C4AA9CE